MVQPVHRCRSVGRFMGADAKPPISFRLIAWCFVLARQSISCATEIVTLTSPCFSLRVCCRPRDDARLLCWEKNRRARKTGGSRFRYLVLLHEELVRAWPTQLLLLWISLG